MRKPGFAPCLWLFTLAAQGCSQTHSIAKSGAAAAAGAAAEPAVEPQPAKLPSVIASNSAGDPIFSYPILGDVDGDGFDDFMLQVSSAPMASDLGPTITQAYLFYGRSAFPAQFTIADADAVFESAGYSVSALGDINGDRLADFSLGIRNGCNFVFGSQARYSGVYGPGAVGVTWTGLARDLAALPTLSNARAAGDVNGDGLSDVLIEASRPGDETAPAMGYLILGHSGSWESGAWNPSWAAAALGSARVMFGGPDSAFDLPLTAGQAADFDGDGFSDLLLAGSNASYIFYGSADGFHDELGAEHADVTLPRAIGFQLYALRDLDGDGADELAVGNGNTLAITYGSRSRLRGTSVLTADLTLTTSGLEPAVGISTAATGDLDGDGAAELVISAKTSQGSVADAMPSTKLLYILRNRSMRALGEHNLSELEPRLFGLETDFGAIKSERLGGLYDAQQVSLSLSGDIDGDGSADILTEGLSGTTITAPGTAVTLIPSVPRDPE